MNLLASRGLMCITDDVARGIADEEALTLFGGLCSCVVETELGPAVLLREIERVLTGGRS